MYLELSSDSALFDDLVILRSEAAYRFGVLYNSLSSRN